MMKTVKPEYPSSVPSLPIEALQRWLTKSCVFQYERRGNPGFQPACHLDKHPLDLPVMQELLLNIEKWRDTFFLMTSLLARFSPFMYPCPFEVAYNWNGKAVRVNASKGYEVTPVPHYLVEI